MDVRVGRAAGRGAGRSAGRGAGPAPDEPAGGGLAAAGWAGIAGPVLFTLVFLAQEAAHGESYSPVAEPVSALEAGPYGWVQQANFVVFGVLTMVFAAGLHRGLRSRRRTDVLGPALLFVTGVGLLLAAVFPLQKDAAGEIYDPGGHVVAGMTFFVGSALGLAVLARRLGGDPRWAGLSRYTLAAGLVALAGAVLTRVLVMPEGAPLHEYAGLVQRALILAVIFPCRVALSARLLQVAGGRR